MPTVTGRGAAWALAAAVASVGGLALVYAALRIGKVGVVAPITSCEGALAAVFSVVFLGEQLSLGVALALAVVACGVVLVTFHAHLSDLHLRPALLAASAAVVFGFGLVASSQAGGVIGPYWTILVSRVVGVVFVAAPLIVSGQLRLPGRALPLVLYSGFAEVTGFVGYITGAQHGVAVSAVLASQFAAVAAFVVVPVLRRAHVPDAGVRSGADRHRRGDRRSVAGLDLQAGVSQLLSSSSSRRRGTAPISFFLTSPPSNTISVGIDSTSSRPAVSLVLVHVQLHERDPVTVLLGQLVEDRLHHAAGRAPGRPEVDHHGPAGLLHLAAERAVADVDDVIAHVLLLARGRAVTVSARRAARRPSARAGLRAARAAAAPAPHAPPPARSHGSSSTRRRPGR